MKSNLYFKLWISLFFFIIAFSTYALSTTQKNTFSTKQKYEQLIDIPSRMQYYNVPAVSLAIIDHGQIVWAKSYNLPNEKTVDNFTQFQAASISKPLAAVIGLSLVEKNKLNLDGNINNVLKTTWKVPENRYTRYQKVTLRRMLSHTAGLSVSGFNGYYSGSNNLPSLIQTLNGQYPANNRAVVPIRVPGRSYMYSGGGYMVTQKAIEDVTGLSFRNLAVDTIFMRLNMTSSTYNLIWPNAFSNIARGHNSNGQVISGSWRLYPESAAAGLWTTSSDIANFIIDIQNTFSGRSNNILSTDMVKQMLRRQANSPMGLGFEITQLNSDVIQFSHSGSNAGYKSDFIAFTGVDQGAVILTNSDNGWPLITEIMQSIADTYHWPQGFKLKSTDDSLN